AVLGIRCAQMKVATLTVPSPLLTHQPHTAKAPMKLLSQRLSGVLKITVILALLTLVSTAFAQDAAPAAEPAAEAPPYESYEKFMETPGYALFTVNNLWLLISASLV